MDEGEGEREMEGKKSEVTVFGTWYSSYCNRVVLALKLKGITYDYVEEDLTNKSQLLLDYNPVHKKVPVLVHGGNPIAESLLILEYIDECWNHAPKLLSDDPNRRSKLRFWSQFYDQKVIPTIIPIITSKGEEREKAIKEFNELISIFEEGTEKDFSGKFPFFSGENFGFIDIVVGVNACNYKAFQEVLGVEMATQENIAFFSKVNALIEHPLIKETIPLHDKMVAKMREKFFKKY